MNFEVKIKSGFDNFLEVFLAKRIIKILVAEHVKQSGHVNRITTNRRHVYFNFSPKGNASNIGQ